MAPTPVIMPMVSLWVAGCKHKVSEPPMPHLKTRVCTCTPINASYRLSRLLLSRFCVCPSHSTHTHTHAHTHFFSLALGLQARFGERHSKLAVHCPGFFGTLTKTSSYQRSTSLQGRSTLATAALTGEPNYIHALTIISNKLSITQSRVIRSKLWLATNNSSPLSVQLAPANTRSTGSFSLLAKTVSPR